MKTSWLTLFLLASAQGLFAQASIKFANDVSGPATGPQAGYSARVYGVDPTNPTMPKTGQSAFGNPIGSTVYGGAPLSGSGFTVQLWGLGVANASSDASFILLDNATSSFLTSDSAGIIAPVSGLTTLPGTAGGPGSRGSFELRAWDNQGGAISSWDQARLSQTAIGVSPIVSPNFDLGMGASAPPGLIGLQSFQLYIVPEPGAIALALCGCLLLLPRRRQSTSP